MLNFGQMTQGKQQTNMPPPPSRSPTRFTWLRMPFYYLVCFNTREACRLITRTSIDLRALHGFMRINVSQPIAPCVMIPSNDWLFVRHVQRIYRAMQDFVSTTSTYEKKRIYMNLSPPFSPSPFSTIKPRPLFLSTINNAFQ